MLPVVHCSVVVVVSAVAVTQVGPLTGGRSGCQLIEIAATLLDSLKLFTLVKL